MAIPRKTSTRLLAFAALLAVLSVASIGMAVSSVDLVRSGATSAFTFLLWGCAGVITGSLSLVLALMAFLRGRSVSRVER